MELGRSGRPMMMMSAGAGAARPTGSSTTIAKNSAALTWGAALTSFVTLYARANRGGAMATDLLEPAERCSGCWPHDGEVAGGAVADSTLVIFRVGATMELGRSGRPMMMSAGAGAARRTGSSTTIAKNSAALTWRATLSQIAFRRPGIRRQDGKNARATMGKPAQVLYDDGCMIE
jgi:hypothetical protein